MLEVSTRVSVFLIVTIAVVLALAVRASLIWVYREWFKEGVFGDAAYHYCIVRALGRKTGAYQGVPEFLIKNGPDRYPIIFHRFASWFDLRTIERHPYFPNFLIFAVFTACLAILICVLPGLINTSIIVTAIAAQEALALLTVIFFVSSVANNALHGHGILFLSLSERLLAKLSVGLYFFSALLWMCDGSLAILATGIVAGYIALASSMFARQAIFSITFLWAIIDLHAAILAPLAGALSLSVAINGKTFVLGLRDQCGFSTSYRMYTAKSRVFLDSLSKFTTFSMASSLRAMARQFWVDEPGKSIFRHSDLVLVLIIGWGNLPPPFIGLLLSTISIYLLTTTKAFRHFGESERYLDYVFVFILPFLVAVEVMRQQTAEAGITVLIAALLYRVVFIAYSLKQDASRTIVGNKSLKDILVEAGVTNDSRILPLPINLGQAISARMDCSVVCYPGVYGKWIFERYIDEYPLIKPKIDEFIDEFKITKIIVHRAQTEHYARVVGWSYDLSKYKKVAESAHWSCYDVR